MQNKSIRGRKKKGKDFHARKNKPSRVKSKRSKIKKMAQTEKQLYSRRINKKIYRTCFDKAIKAKEVFKLKI